MASFTFVVKGEKNLSRIYLRFCNGRHSSTHIKTELFINPKHWDKKRQRVRNLAEALDKDFVNSTLEKLSSHMVDRMNKDCTEEGGINREWARKTVKEFFGHSEGKDKIFFLDYCEKYIHEAPQRMRKGKIQGLALGTIKKYKTCLERLRGFEELKRIRLKFSDINLNFHRDFLHYLVKHEKLHPNTAGTRIASVKAFCRNAKLEGYNIDKDLDHPNFFVTSSESKSIYLNDEEINKIFALDLSGNDRLDNARDNAIVGLRTGLRVGDFLQLKSDHIKDGYIEVKTKKTGHEVIIPLHPQVKTILEKRAGLPRKISDQKFNLYFKEVCQWAGIVEEVEGALMNPDTRRKEEGIFPKYQLVSSHTCRRSFATNLYGKLPNLSIMAITGHKTEKQFLEYVKITPREHAEKLKELWENGILPA